MVDTTRASAAAPPARDEQRGSDIPALTGLRWFAAVVVVAYHLREQLAAIAPARIAIAANPLLEGGLLGVDVFFVLSGFVIAHTYAYRLESPAPGVVRDYLVARLARVYPLHLITLIAMVVLFALGAVEALDPDAGADATPLGFVGNLLMLQALPGIPAWNYPAWSISCELGAYLLFPLVAARLLRVRWTSALALAAAVLCLQLFVQYQLSVAGVGLQAIYWPRIAGEFTVGALLWVVWSRVLRRGLWGDAVVALCALGSVLLLWHGYPWPLAVPLLAAIIPAAACATGPVAGLLAHPVTQWGGRISYALYLVHLPVITAVLVWAVPSDVYVHRSAVSTLTISGGMTVAMVVAAALLHHGVEEPARRCIRRGLARRTTRSATKRTQVTTTTA